MLVAYLILADTVAIIHAVYVLFVVGGLGVILTGIARRWEWVRNFWFRVAHLGAIGLVCVQWFVGVACPLTTLENRLREMGGGMPYPHDFVAYWVDWLIFYNLPNWVFTVAYPAVGVLIAALFILAPPRWPWHRYPAGQGRA